MIFRNLCLLVVGAGSSFAACDKTTVREAAGNGMVYADVTSDKAVAGEDITINRFRIMKSTGNSTSPGAVSLRDMFYIDMWATLSGETKPRYANQGPFVADADGNLYQEGTEPGTIAYNATLAGAVGEAISYTRTATDGLIDEEYDAQVETQSVVTGTTATPITTVTNVIIKPSAQDASFVNLRTRTYVSSVAFNRTRYENNTTGTIKGKLGCINTVTTTATSNTVLAATPTWYDVQLGNILSDKDGVTSSGAAADGSASDQILWVKWSEKWYITGVNVSTHVVRMVRERSAPFYLNRELVGRTKAIAAGGAAAPSGFETMIRACSAAAVDGTGTTTTFKISSPATTTAGSTTNLSGFSRTLGSAAPTCTALNTVAATVALTGAYTAVPFSCNGNYASGTLGVTYANGTWNGTYSAGVISSAGNAENAGNGSATTLHVEHSAIVETTF